MNAWAQSVADRVGAVMEHTGREWVSAPEYAERYGYSRSQAAHILRRAMDYGVLRRQPLRAAGLDPADHRTSRYVWTVAAPAEVPDGS